MNSREYQEIQKAYFEVYEDQQIDEVSDELANKARKERWNRTGVAMEKDLGNMKSGPSPEFQASYKKAQNNERRFNEKTQKEEVDLHAAILSHLLDEGYADTIEAAEGIMVSWLVHRCICIAIVAWIGRIRYASGKCCDVFLTFLVSSASTFCHEW